MFAVLFVGLVVGLVLVRAPPPPRGGDYFGGILMPPSTRTTSPFM